MARVPIVEEDITITLEIDADVLEMTSMMERLTRDSYNSRSASAQIELLGENEIAEQWQWVALLDGDVCPECEELDGEIFSVGDDEPPLHPNCRCSISAVIDVDALKDIVENLAE